MRPPSSDASDEIAAMAEAENFLPVDGFFSDIAEAVVEPPRYIIKNLLMPGLVIVGGPPKCGKSILAIIAGCIISGHKCTALPPSLSQLEEGQDGAAMFFSYEMTKGELRYTVEQGLGVTLQANEGMLAADDPWQWQLDDADAIEQMLWWMRERRPKLVVVDPFRNAHSMDEKDSGIIRLLAPLRKWAVDNNSCVMVVHHTSKLGEEQKTYSVDKLRGTGALFGMADQVLMVTPLSETTFGKWKLQAIFKRAPGWTQEVQLAVWGVKHASVALGEIEQLILRAIGGGKDTVEELRTALKLPSVGAYLARLAELGHIQKEGRRWTVVKGAA